jgi:2-C-methyl-D-erythritol 2,4-cyclodiphosphate synthase
MNFRIGHGYDLHRLQHHGQLLLGGVICAEDLSAVAHSDGDVVIHALVDAILGATGHGDIGQMFPNTDARWKDAPSRLFLQTVIEQTITAGYKIINADVTVLAERPRLAPHRQAIRQCLAELLQVPITHVNIKAGTNEGVDAIGKGEAIAAHAVVLLSATV